MRLNTANNGFTLIEVAMVLVVVGLLIGLGAGLVGPMMERAKLIESREQVKSVQESILGYAARYKKLPASLADLGVRTTDAYNRPMVYAAASVLTTSNLCTSSASLLVIDDSSSGTAQTKNNVAFLLFAEGTNRINNTGTASPFTIREQGVADYDDIAVYTDIDKLRSQICTSFRVSTETLPLGTEETAYPSTTLEATDGTPAYTWSILSGGLPSGMSLSTAGAISGTPTIDGSYNLTVQVLDSETPNRVATKSLTVTINPNKPRIMTELLAYGVQDQSYTSSLGATGGKAPYNWALTAGSTLPAGLSLSSSGGLSGTPTVSGTYSFSITITDAGGRTAAKTLSLAINPSGGSGSSCGTLSLSPTSGSNFAATVGTAFNRSITVAGGQAPYTNTQCVPATCNGLSLSCGPSGATISGTPTSTGTCNFSLGWQDSCTTPAAQTINGAYSVSITAAPCAAFTGWNWNLPTVANCQSYSGNTSVMGGVAPLSWSSTPLPNGLLFCTGNTSATCNLSGTPLTAPGTYSMTQQVTDSCGSGAQTSSQNFTLTVTDSCYSSGISLRNQSGGARYYRRNGGGCTTWNNNSNITVAVADSITVFSNNSCTTSYCGSAVTYCQQKLYDADNDCQTRMNAGCSFVDR